eukprot:3748856-Ditylum_brightwellii.AAC.1
MQNSTTATTKTVNNNDGNGSSSRNNANDYTIDEISLIPSSLENTGSKIHQKKHSINLQELFGDDYDGDEEESQSDHQNPFLFSSPIMAIHSLTVPFSFPPFDSDDDPTDGSCSPSHDCFYNCLAIGCQDGTVRIITYQATTNTASAKQQFDTQIQGQKQKLPSSPTVSQSKKEEQQDNNEVSTSHKESNVSSSSSTNNQTRKGIKEMNSSSPAPPSSSLTYNLVDVATFVVD